MLLRKPGQGFLHIIQFRDVSMHDIALSRPGRS